MFALKIPTVAIVSAALFLGACNDPAQLANGNPNQNRNQGAIAGGILGAGLGAIVGNGAKGAMIGAVGGTIAGAAIGDRLDRQAAELRGQMTSDGITITNTGSTLVVSLPNGITFDTASYTVRSSLRPDLGRLAQHLLKYPDSTVRVIGHTDSDGSAAFNIGLSERRANAVADVLQADGVPFNRLQTIGRGEEEPIATNLTEEGKARNRRVEVVIIPNS
jgi:outer membrane protein OmpA-like peptidoglycan-associated protein